MVCPAIETGGRFLASVLGQVDCQAQTIGAYGFGALSATGSPAFAALTALLTVFVAIFGIRIMFGADTSGRDFVADALRVGIVLLLATSWPAWRTIGYNLVLNGPAEIAAVVGGSAGLPGSQRDLNARLQAADDGIVALTMFGTGRLTGGIVEGGDLGDQTRGIALPDLSGLAWGRVAFLVGAIAPLGIVRLGAGVLLALAPIMAALLLFVGTRDLFFGWLRALVACGLGVLVLTLVQSTQLALLEPWLRGALAQRQADILTPSAPTELIVIAFSFALICLGLLTLTARLAFFRQLGVGRFSLMLGERLRWQTASGELLLSAQASRQPADAERSRAERISDAVASSVRREGWAGSRGFDRLAVASAQGTDGAPATGYESGALAPSGRLGSSYRRSQLRRSAAGQQRDQSP